MEDSVVIQAERISGEFLLEQVKSSYPILGKGSVNQVCLVETECHKVVVRMNHKSAYPSYIKEKWCVEQAAAVGIPGPEVLSIGITDDTAYMIQSFVEGDNGLESPVLKSNIWRQLGRYVRCIQSIPVKGFGENLIDPAHGEFQSPAHAGSDGSWQGYLQYNINSLTEYDRLIEFGVVTKTESKRVRELFETLNKDKLCCGLCHGDISLKNTIINQAGQVILLDWGSAEVGMVPYGDLIQLMGCQLLGEEPNIEELQAFLDGCGINDKYLIELRCFVLLRAFDKLRWAIDQSPDLIEPFTAFAKKVVEMVMYSSEVQ